MRGQSLFFPPRSLPHVQTPPIWCLLGRPRSRGYFFTDAIGHATAPLQALVAYCHFAATYHRTPVGLPVPGVLTQAKKPNWDEKLNRLLQELAWDAVTQHPLSGIKAEAKSK
jgi:hypothetical protein